MSFDIDAFAEQNVNGQWVPAFAGDFPETKAFEALLNPNIAKNDRRPEYERRLNAEASQGVINLPNSWLVFSVFNAKCARCLESEDHGLIPSIAEERGVPDDCSERLSEILTKPYNYNNVTYVTLSELLAYDGWETVVRHWGDWMDCNSSDEDSKPLKDYYDITCFRARIEAMKALGNPENIRIYVALPGNIIG